MKYIRFIFVLYWFAPFLKFGPLPSENPRCPPGYGGSYGQPKKFNLVPRKINLVPKKFNSMPNKLYLVPKKFSLVSKKIQFSAEKILFNGQ